MALCRLRSLATRATIRAHLLRWRPRQPAQRTASTPRRLPSGAASQLDPSPRASCVFSDRLLDQEIREKEVQSTHPDGGDAVLGDRAGDAAGAGGMGPWTPSR